MSNKWRSLCLLLALLCGQWNHAGIAHAADTTECFGKGAVDAELFVGLADVGASTGRAATELVLGYGLTERLSLVVAATLEGALQEDVQRVHAHLGGLFNLVDTAHFDLDFILWGHVGGAGFASWQIVPGFELNLDSDDQRQGVGVYLRAGVALGSHDERMQSSHRLLLAWELPLTLGSYWTVAEGHQLLLEVDGGVMPQSDPAQRFNFGGVALGYNLVITSWLELINQIYVDLPQGSEPVGYAATTGVIMTL